MWEEVRDDVRVGLEFLENGDLAHGGGWDTFVLVLELDSLEGHIVPHLGVPGAKHYPISALAEALALLVAVFNLVHFSTLKQLL